MPDMRIMIESSKASGHRSGWWKRITSIDTTKKGGFSLNGDFLKSGENDLPLGAVVIEKYPTGSVKNGVDKAKAYRVEDAGLVEFAKCEDWYKQFLTFRDALMAALKTGEPTIDELATHGRRIRGVSLRAERARLVERLAEIDRQLADEHPQGAEDGRDPLHSQ